MLRNLESAGNPWGMPQAQRADWAEGLERPGDRGGPTAPEYLYWVGCAGAFDDRATLDLEGGGRSCSQRAGVSFAILGPRELCTGDPARRIGNEYLFQTLAEQNVETLSGAGVTKVDRQLPALLQHAAQRVPRLRRDVRGDPPLAAVRTAGRRGAPPADRARSPPRSPTTTRATSGATTASTATRAPRWRQCPAFGPWRCRVTANARCAAGRAAPGCGWRNGSASGSTQERAEEAAATGADTVGVACPYCLIMLDDGERARGGRTEVLDLAQVLARSVVGPNP